MLEYVFFDEGLRDKFVQFLQVRGVQIDTADNDNFLVMVPDDLDDELSDEIDYRYELLLQENADLLESEEGAVEKSAAGVRVELSDGTPCMVRLSPELLKRMLGCISMEELRDMVQSIALQVEDPDDLPVCHTK